MEILRFSFISELEDYITGSALNDPPEGLGLDLVYQPGSGSNFLNRIVAIVNDPNGGFVAFIDTTEDPN